MLKSHTKPGSCFILHVASELNKQSLKEVQMANKYVGKIFSVFSHQGNAMRNPLRLHLTPVRTVIIKKNNKQQILLRTQEERNYLYTTGRKAKTPEIQLIHNFIRQKRIFNHFSVHLFQGLPIYISHWVFFSFFIN